MKAEYKKALQEIYSKTPKDNFLAINFDYGKSLLLPYEEGLKLLACLRQAELLMDSYGKPKQIRPFDSDKFQTTVFSRKDYEDIKVAAMLGVTVEELLAPSAVPETT